MQCERLINLAKSWYIHVKNETMAPARMVSFIQQHADSCEICQNDSELPDEIAKITEMILPESKIPKAVRQQNKAEEEQYEEPDDDEETDDENDDEFDEDSDIDEDI